MRVALHKRLAAGASIVIVAATATVLGTSTAAFAVTPGITSVAPNAGATAGGTAITITGTAFTGTTGVTVGGVAATAVVVVDDSHVTATTPAHAVGTVDVILTNGTGPSAPVAGDQFTYTVLPVVTSISPTAGPVAGTTSVTITGTGLTGATGVNFGATAGTAVTVVNDSTVTVTSPAHAAGAVDVRVTTPGGQSVTGAGDLFTYTAIPVITSISPTAGPLAGATTVTITGTSLSGITAVTFGGVAATSFANVSATSATAVSPTHVAGAVDIVVTTVGGPSATGAGDLFTYTAGPTITSILPTAGPTTGATTVTLTGTGLTGISAVSFGGTAGTAVTPISATSASAVSPAHAAGAVDVTATTPGGTSPTGAGDMFTYTAAPVVTSISPATGSIAGGPVVTITGTGFTGATAVAFGATAATSFAVVSATSITAVSPAHSTGAVDIRVTTAGGQSGIVGADSYTYVTTARPTITSISPTTGPTAGATTVTITGTGLTGSTAVSFGGTAATSFANVSATSATAVSPAGGAGAFDVTITTPGGISATGAGDMFTYTAPAGGGGAPAPTTPAVPVRLSGTDRFGTAIAASTVEFPSAGTAGAVVLARADDYPDALVGAALAHAKNAPLLFANGGLLTAATQAEIQRVLPAGGTVYLLGGTAAIPATVATSLTSLGFVPVRYAGTDRFGTALAVADALNDPSTVLLATGVNFPDALAAGPAAAHLNGVVLLTNGSSLTPAVTAYLAAHPGTVYAIGGPAVAADPSATALSGADRYATAAMVASTLFTSTANVGVASGTAFPDALSGGAFQAHFGGPIVLTDPHILPTSTSAYLTATKGTIVTTNIFGGDTALSVTVQTAVGTALGM